MTGVRIATGKAMNLVDRLRGERDQWRERCIREQHKTARALDELAKARAEIARLETITELTGWLR